ncbi:hypothetical protein AKJ16_DCAP10098 [Drosera capensis]
MGPERELLRRLRERRRERRERERGGKVPRRE